jgi:ATP adenylyltransferase
VALWERARTATAHALATGALGPISTRAHPLEDAGARFVLRTVSSLAAKERAARDRPAGDDPFAPYDPDLFVADVEPAHVLLLNKFPVFEDHLLLVTRAFEEQLDPLTAADFAALYACMDGDEALAFYNAGSVAGASQRHKHLQLVRPDVASLDPRALPVPHASAARPRDPIEAHARYVELCAEVGLGAREPYNLLVTADAMIVIPRSRETHEGVSVNALGFVGSLLVRSEADLERVRGIGPMSILRAVAR